MSMIACIYSTLICLHLCFLCLRDVWVIFKIRLVNVDILTNSNVVINNTEDPICPLPSSLKGNSLQNDGTRLQPGY